MWLFAHPLHDGLHLDVDLLLGRAELLVDLFELVGRGQNYGLRGGHVYDGTAYGFHTDSGAMRPGDTAAAAASECTRRVSEAQSLLLRLERGDRCSGVFGRTGGRAGGRTDKVTHSQTIETITRDEIPLPTTILLLYDIPRGCTYYAVDRTFSRRTETGLIDLDDFR